MSLLAGAGVGSGIAVLHTDKHTAPAPPPQALVDRLSSEQRLIAAAEAAAVTEPGSAAVITAIRADHLEHAAVLANLIAAASVGTVAVPSAGSGGSTAGPTAAPAVVTVADLVAAEKQAAAAAARHALQLTDRDATVLASIAACEASHVGLLS